MRESDLFPEFPRKFPGDFPGTSLTVDFKSFFPEVPLKFPRFFGTEKAHTLFQHKLFGPHPKHPIWAPRKELMCLISWARTQKGDPHKLFWGNLRGQKGGPKQPIFGHIKFSFFFSALRLPRKFPGLPQKHPEPSRGQAGQPLSLGSLSFLGYSCMAWDVVKLFSGTHPCRRNRITDQPLTLLA